LLSVTSQSKSEKSNFIKSFSQLLTGSLVSQALNFIFIPVLARLYSPSYFAQMAVFASLVTVLGANLMLRYEQAFVLTTHEEEPKLLALCSLLALVLFFPLAAIFSIIYGVYYGLSIVIIAVGYAYYRFNIQVLNKEGKYFFISTSAVMLTLIYVFTSLALSHFYYIEKGLLLARALSYISVGAFSLFLLQALIGKAKQVSFSGVKEVSKKYLGFFKFSLPAGVLSLLVSQLPIIMMPHFYGLKNTGFYSMCFSLLSVPVSLISSNIGTVYREHAVNDCRELGNCYQITIKTMSTLARIALIPFLIVFFGAHYLFDLFLGGKWQGAGVYARVFSFQFYFAFVVSPLTYLVYIVGKQHIDFIWQGVLFVGVLSCFFYNLWFGSFYSFVVSFTVFYSIMYIIYIPILLKMARAD
jgi:O-antigen/teichoic acid export membrane protein